MPVHFAQCGMKTIGNFVLHFYFKTLGGKVAPVYGTTYLDYYFQVSMQVPLVICMYRMTKSS